MQPERKETIMKRLVTALGLAALLIGGTAAQSMTIGPGLTATEQAAVRQLVPEASLNGISRSQASALSRIVRNSAHNSRTDARRAVRNALADKRWLLPSRPGAR
jgi:uncharacterized lipoprotein YajG